MPELRRMTANEFEIAFLEGEMTPRPERALTIWAVRLAGVPQQHVTALAKALLRPAHLVIEEFNGDRYESPIIASDELACERQVAAFEVVALFRLVEVAA
jgi:hypothetical protein